ncbi:hypothetical protein FYK55_15710 [Roseiconus nitratireducens]|uniref:Uncharacterized protein n=1 Tax=Roseiconus nitratireducens TaxID=2605748 RepID=A0A5M6D408_9BACT|nr:hypothetical protein [Roseiconus nitratireducens]KAA5542247.1 hypothetical protein FYK55_15710 [Roseiconus nitratireducens]
MRCFMWAIMLPSVWLLSIGLAGRAAAVDVLASADLGPADQPYGVGTIELPLANPIVGAAPPPLTVASESGRVLYPAAEEVETRITPVSELPVPPAGNGRLLGRLGNLIRELTDEDAPKTQIVARRVHFLFTGTEPLQVRVGQPGQEIGVYQLNPQRNPSAFAESMASWWQAFTANAKRQIDDGDYPPWVETYLIAMLSGRTGNSLPAWFLERAEDDDPLWKTLKVLGGAEEVSGEIFRQTAAGLTDDNRPVPANPDPVDALPLPAGPRWVQPTFPEIDPDVQTEPIASRVPPECFYFRFGSFANYLWFLDLTNEHGGDLSRMITLRGTGGRATERFEKQLSLKINQMTRMLGPTVIEDQAVIGRDLYTEDGATMGVLMKSTNAFLLRSSLSNDRNNAARTDATLSLEQVSIGGNQVSLLSSPDNRVRSFLAEDQGYFLITNSRSLVERFFQVGQSGESLAATEAFRLSRMLVPVSRQDTIFAYFSPQMLQNLVSPEYLIELRRRTRAESDISLVHLARLAAKAEGVRPETGQTLGVPQLIESGFLPVSFDDRHDGSGVISAGDQMVDTLRGSRGTFLPIGDVEIESVTPQESRWYKQIADEYTQRFPQMDPIIVALRREEVPGNTDLERIAIHAEIAPLTPEKYGTWARQLGPPTNVEMRFAPDDLVSVQAHVASDQLGPPTHLFVGIKDNFPPDPNEFKGLLNTYWALRELPSYLGAWPQPGVLDRLPLGLGRGRPVGPGMSRLIGGLYRYTGGGFSVLSFQPEVLNSTLPFLEATETQQSATVRGRVGSLLDSQLEGWVNDQLYQRAARSSVAGASFLNLLSRQLSVPPEQASETATFVLGKPLQCSLGGQYEYNASDGLWRSTAWKGSRPAATPPNDYVAPLLLWFRGSDFTMTQYADRLVADASITVARGVDVGP